MSISPQSDHFRPLLERLTRELLCIRQRHVAINVTSDLIGSCQDAFFIFGFA